MDDQRKNYLLKLMRGNIRRALHAITELRLSNDPGLVNAIAQSARSDEQRAFQIRIAGLVLEKGIEGLVDEWADLGAANWHAYLISEIGQFLHHGCCWDSSGSHPPIPL